MFPVFIILHIIIVLPPQTTEIWKIAMTRSGKTQED